MLHVMFRMGIASAMCTMMLIGRFDCTALIMVQKYGFVRYHDVLKPVLTLGYRLITRYGSNNDNAGTI